MSEHRTQASCLFTTKLFTSSKLYNFCDVWRPEGRVQDDKCNPIFPHIFYVRGKWGILRYCKTRDRKVMPPSKALTNDMPWCGEQRFAIIRKAWYQEWVRKSGTALCSCGTQYGWTQGVEHGKFTIRYLWIQKKKITDVYFYVLLTVHLEYNRVKKNQLDAQPILSVFLQLLHVSGISRPIMRRYNRI